MYRTLRGFLTPFSTGHINTRTMVMKNLKNLSPAEKLNFVKSFTTIFSDCDGVLWLGTKVIDKAPEVMNGLKKQNKSIFYLTNNSLKTPDNLAMKFKNMGFETQRGEVLCTALLTAEYLKLKKFDKKVYLLTSTAVKEEIERVGISNIGCGPDLTNAGEVMDMSESLDLDPDVGAVVVGYDVHFNYAKLLKASAYLSSSNVEFLATNTDERFPMPGGRLIPGAGSFVKAVETASGRTPTVVGKPSTLAFEYVQKTTNLKANEALMIGDRCNTDISFGKKSGMQTLLVLTGVHKLEDIERFKKEGKDDLVPDFYTDSIADLLEFVELCKK